jgi:hypothetical protein
VIKSHREETQQDQLEKLKVVVLKKFKPFIDEIEASRLELV